MKITNKMGLPEPLIRAIENDPYDREGCDYSATELIAPPYQKNLQRLHAQELEIDASERIWSLFGQAVHHVLERSSPGYVIERRYIGEFWVPMHGIPDRKQAVKVGARIDVFDAENGILSDYKTTSVFKFKAGYDGFLEVPEEYEAQINIQAELIYRETGHEVQKGQIIGILRDWRRSESQREQGYPQYQVQIMPVPIWPHAKREAYIMERLALHRNPEPEPCSAHDRWERPTVIALMKAGQKKAVRLYDEQDSDTATEARDKMNGSSGVQYSLVTRPGERTRCKSYCDVASKCPFHQEYLRQVVEIIQREAA